MKWLKSCKQNWGSSKQTHMGVFSVIIMFEYSCSVYGFKLDSCLQSISCAAGSITSVELIPLIKTILLHFLQFKVAESAAE